MVKALRNMLLHSVFPPFQKGKTQILKISKRGGNLKKNLVGGKPKGGGKIFKNKGRGTQLFKLKLGIKNKNEDI